MSDTTPTSGKDEFVALMLLVKKAIVDSTTVVDLNILIPALENHIAQQNQQVVQKALEGLLEQKQHFSYGKSENGYSEIVSIEAVPVPAIEAELATAQPRKEARGAE